MARSTTFAGTDRFELIRKLGAGTFGAVYEALDRRHGERVALKVLAAMDPESLYRFKREFRVLTQLRNPNLVSLYELASHEDHWFFTMELLEALPFDGHVAGHRAMDIHAPTAPGTALVPPSPTPASQPKRAFGGLREALIQLVRGVRALHRAGKLHRDIKPSNVLITDSGRVVLLDFGMVTELGPDQSVGDQLLGTVSYMAPEQAECVPLNEAADWYSVGVLLFRVLTGRLPHEGSVAQVLLKKVTEEAPPLSQLQPGLPDDLSDLCQRLLSREPSVRPTGDQILRMLGVRREHLTDELLSGGPLVGRGQELQVMQQALTEVQQGSPRVVLVEGDSGVGKTALVATFLDGLTHPNLLELHARCYDRESVPYKAVDGLVDALARHLHGMDPQQVAQLLPAGAAQLARLFPVLRRIPQLDSMASAFRSTTMDQQQQRLECFEALRRLVQNIGRTNCLVLFVDDLQWGDADSARLLLHLLRPPDAPVLLLVGACRVGEAGQFLRMFLQEASTTLGEQLVRLPLPPLEEQAAQDLARSLVGKAEGVILGPKLAREAAGNPFFIRELALHLREVTPGQRPDSDITLDGMLAERVSRLPDDARLLLEVVAVAGQPIEETIACKAAGLTGGERVALERLRNDHLIRGAGSGAEDTGELLTAYHDRIRETLVARLEPKALACHNLRLARSLEAAGVTDRDEALADHFAAGGAPDQAAGFTIHAAERAASALAFEHAAMLYRRALELAAARDAQQTADLHARLASALSKAGHGAEAGPEYQVAAELAGDPHQSQEWRRCAAEELLRSGHVERGLEVLQEVLAEVGLSLPGSGKRAMFSILLRRAQLRLRGLRFTERAEDQIPRQELARVDAAWTVVTGLAFSHTLISMAFQVLHLLLALKAGEPYRVARGLAMESSSLATMGASEQRTERVYQQAGELARRLDHPHLLGLVETAAAFGAAMQGRFQEVPAHAEEALRWLRRWPGTHWEQGVVSAALFMASAYLGEFPYSTNREQQIREAEQLGDMTLAANLKIVGHIQCLARDRPEQARRYMEEVLEVVGSGEVSITHGIVATGLASVELYEGRPLAALKHLDQVEARLKRSMTLRIKLIRIAYYSQRGRTATAAAFESPQWLDLARANRKRLLREKTNWARLVSAGIQASISAAEGQPAEAESHLRELESMAEDEGVPVIREIARYQRAWITRDPELHERAAHQLLQHGIVNPTRMCNSIAPMAPPECWEEEWPPLCTES